MTESLDKILSGAGEATPAPETTEPQTTTETTETPESAETEEAVSTTTDGQKMVPLAALHASKEKAKRYTEQVASFEKKLEESNFAWERRMAQLTERLAPPQQPPQAPDWFENPNAAAMHAVGPHLQQFQQTLQANAKLIAGTKYTDEKVEEAEQAFLKAFNAQTLDPADYQKVVNSPNRYAAAVQWRARQQAQQEIGDDPAAYKERVRAEVLAELETGDKPVTNGAAPVMPSNLVGARNVGVRSGPAWSGPTPLADIFKR